MKKDDLEKVRCGQNRQQQRIKWYFSIKNLKQISFYHLFPSVVIVDICDDYDYGLIIYRSYEFSFLGISICLDVPCNRKKVKKALILMPDIVIKSFIKKIIK